MTTLDAILRAILDRPMDDTPRLVYAEYLDDHAGDMPDPDGARSRAEFIRIGVEAARTTAHCYHDLTRPPDCPVCALHLRAAELARLPAADADGEPACMWERWADLPGWACLNLIGDAVADRIEAGLRRRREETNDDRPGGNYFRFRRGFVDEVRLPLAAFAGGPCGRCDGRGRLVDDNRPPEDDPPCPVCRCQACKATGDARGYRLAHNFERCKECRGAGSTGTRPGVAASLFAAHPVTRVVLTDRETDPIQHYARRQWCWYMGAVDSRATIPRGVFMELAGGDLERADEDDPDTDAWVIYRTPELARTALSAACVAHGRELAGLPPL